MNIAASSLISLSYLEDYLGGEASAAITSGSSLESQLAVLIDAVSARFDAYLGRKLAKTIYTAEKYDGPKGLSLWLRNYPVVSIGSIEEDDVELVEGMDDDYVVDYVTGEIIRSSNWQRRPQIISATYTAGYVVQEATPGAGETALPYDIALACCIQVAAEWKKTQSSAWGVSSVSYPEAGSISRFERGLLKDVEDMLAPYRRFLI